MKLTKFRNFYLIQIVMGFKINFILGAFIVLLSIVTWMWLNLDRPVSHTHLASQLDANKYWGPGDSSSQPPTTTAIEPMTIAYSRSVIDELQLRLIVDPGSYHMALNDSDLHSYGIDTQTFLEFLQYWRDDYLDKWSEREEILNSVPHFTTNIQGLNIHYVHIKPNAKAGQLVRPLLLLHGWPGSVREFYDLFELLVSPSSPIVFEIIAPSLPGFGWSDGSAKVGFGPAECAVVLNSLMQRLGHKRFYIQGGDWGSIIGSHLATIYPESVIGYHSNFCMPKTLKSALKWLIASIWPSAFLNEPHIGQMFPLLDKLQLMFREAGSFHIQATKPDTLSAVLYSPIALGAYLQEKFISAIPSHDVDAILDNIMIYYLTQSFLTGARLYAEDVSARQVELDLWRIPTDVPTGCTRFPFDIGQSLDWQLLDKYPNLVHSSWQTFGGHFAALEVPDILYKDFLIFVMKNEKHHPEK